MWVRRHRRRRALGERCRRWAQLMRRGEIRWVDPEPSRGAQANKRHPAVIVKNAGANVAASRLGRGVVIVVPVTSNTERIHPFQVLLDRPPPGWVRPPRRRPNRFDPWPSSGSESRSAHCPRPRSRPSMTPCASIWRSEHNHPSRLVASMLIVHGRAQRPTPAQDEEGPNPVGSGPCTCLATSRWRREWDPRTTQVTGAGDSSGDSNRHRGPTDVARGQALEHVAARSELPPDDLGRNAVLPSAPWL